jgi:hypothetical protein
MLADDDVLLREGLASLLLTARGWTLSASLSTQAAAAD